MTAELVEFVKQREGCRYEAYWDPNGRVWTIGYGATGPHIVEGLHWTQAECDSDLIARLDRAQAQVVMLSPGIKWPPGAQDALTDFVYNVGAGNYEKSTVLQCVMEENWDGVRAHLLDWEFSGGKRLGGLVTRREGEAAMIKSNPMAYSSMRTLIGAAPVTDTPTPVPPSPPVVAVTKPELSQISNYVGAAVAVIGNALPYLTPDFLSALGLPPAAVHAVSSIAAVLLIAYREKIPPKTGDNQSVKS